MPIEGCGGEWKGREDMQGHDMTYMNSIGRHGVCWVGLGRDDTHFALSNFAFPDSFFGCAC